MNSPFYQDKNRIKRYFSDDTSFDDPRESHLTADLYAGNGTYVDVEMDTKTGFVTIYWEDKDERHRVTYSIILGTVLCWNSTPIRKSA